ncbi:GNAT family N-acetyltransferase [Kribbella sp. NPDC049227]|uniref:GNAT family N-acetyltransferase n=1 Tax=Kribbella sp. NPDC049227 TaxID=3364113 RepID=UPI00371E757B
MQEILQVGQSRTSVFRLGADDWRTLRELRLQALADSPDSFFGEMSAERDYSEKHWRQELDLNVWLTATSNTRQIGLVKLNCNARALDDLHLEALWVTPDMRRRGVGGILVSALESVAATEGAPELRLWVFIENHSARDFYLRLGYTRTPVVQDIKSNGRRRREQEYQKHLEPVGSRAHSE